METQNNRVALDQHWAASASGDLEAEHQIYDDNVVCEYPQSGEKIRGRRNLQALRGHHPGKPSGFLIRRIVGINDLWITEYVINYTNTVVQTVSIMEFQNGRVIHETQYFCRTLRSASMALAMGGKGQIAHGMLKWRRDKGGRARLDIHSIQEFGTRFQFHCVLTLAWRAYGSL